jgi:hypothetical protein
MVSAGYTSKNWGKNPFINPNMRENDEKSDPEAELYMTCN